MGRRSVTPTNDYTAAAIQIGGIVRQLWEMGAYRDVVMNRKIGAAANAQLPGQWVKGPIKQLGGPDIQILAANQPDYMVFWVARGLAYEYFGQDPECETRVEALRAGCEMIAEHLRHEWGVYVPPRTEIIEPPHRSSLNR